MSFQETLDALEAEEKATALTDERFQEARAIWSEIETRRTALRNRTTESDGNGDILARTAGLVRKYGPKASKYFGWPSFASALTAATMADEGTFIGESGILSLLAQVFGW